MRICFFSLSHMKISKYIHCTVPRCNCYSHFHCWLLLISVYCTSSGHFVFLHVMYINFLLHHLFCGFVNMVAEFSLWQLIPYSFYFPTVSLTCCFLVLTFKNQRTKNNTNVSGVMPVYLSLWSCPRPVLCITRETSSNVCKMYVRRSHCINIFMHCLPHI